MSYLKNAMNSFTAGIGIWGYHVCRETTWRNITSHQQVKNLKKKNSSISVDTDPYCCKMTIKRVGRIICKGTRTIVNIAYRLSPSTEGGLEIPFLVHFVRKNNAILNKMKTSVSKKYIKGMKNSSLIRR